MALGALGGLLAPIVAVDDMAGGVVGLEGESFCEWAAGCEADFIMFPATGALCVCIGSKGTRVSNIPPEESDRSVCFATEDTAEELMA